MVRIQCGMMLWEGKAAILFAHRKKTFDSSLVLDAMRQQHLAPG